MANPPFLPIGSDDPADSCLAKHNWRPDASTHCNELPKDTDGLKYRKRDDGKSGSTLQCKPKESLPPVELNTITEDQQCAFLEQSMRQMSLLMRSLEALQTEMKSHEKIDVKMPREEDLERLIQKSNDTEATLVKLRETLRTTEDRTASERKMLIESERQVNEEFSEAKQAMDSSIAELSQQLRQYQSIATAFRLATGLTVETQGSAKMRGASVGPRPFTFELEIAGSNFHYRNLTKSSEHLDAFLKHDISSLHNSELPILFRRMLTTLRQTRN